MKVNRQFKLAARPIGLPERSDWSFCETPIPEPSENQILIKIDYISLDPAMRGWLRGGKSYIPPVAIGEVMRALTAGTVIASNNSDFRVGDTVTSMHGVQEYGLSDGSDLRKVDTTTTPLEKYLGILGMPGMTAYFGLLDIGKPKEGETLVVSAAAGAVGAMVGQLAKIYGCKVIGIAGGAHKCQYLLDELGFDAAIDYKNADFKDSLRQVCTEGVDIYFDNVGGDILNQVLTDINLHARIVLCGAISQYNKTTTVGPSNYLSLLINRARMEGFIVMDYFEKYEEAVEKIAGWLNEGKLQSKEDIVEGIENFPTALLKLFSGENLGKLLIKNIHQ